MMDDVSTTVATEPKDFEREYYLLAGRFSVLKNQKELQEVVTEEQKRVIAHLEKKVRELETRLERAERSPA